MSNVFKTLNAVNVNGHTESKQGLTYLSWAWAWQVVKDMYPSATFEVHKFGEDKLPYQYDPTLGYMCWTTVTIEGESLDMWLPVMDGNNKSMKAEPYEYTVKSGKKRVEAATMFDINKTIMRCLVKNLGLFGLGLYIYSGEDLPEAEVLANASLKEKITEIKSKASALVKAGVDVKDIYKIIEGHNNGQKNPDTLDSLENAEKIMTALNEIKAPAKKKEKSE